MNQTKKTYKLSNRDVVEIREWMASGKKQLAIARRKNVSIGTIRLTSQGKLHGHVKADGTGKRANRNCGQKCSFSKLTDAKVKRILVRIAKGHNLRTIATDTRMSIRAIQYIATGETWRHIPRLAASEASR